MHIIDRAFKRAPKYYIRQSLMSVAVVFIILYFVNVLSQLAIVAALGASTFIVFAMPRSTMAEPRSLIGGHAVGLLSGFICYSAFLAGHLGRLTGNGGFLFALACALSIGLSIFLMTITDTEHPPAAATALGVVAHGWSYQVAIFVLVCAVVLAISRRVLSSRLKDLV